MDGKCLFVDIQSQCYCKFATKLTFFLLLYAIILTCIVIANSVIYDVFSDVIMNEIDESADENEVEWKR